MSDLFTHAALGALGADRIGRRAELTEMDKIFGSGVWISAGLVIQPTVNRQYCRFVLTIDSDVVL